VKAIQFTKAKPGGDRQHYVDAEDIAVALGRLPEEVVQRLRAVHLNDRSKGVRVLGYVNLGLREIALCALPPRVSLARFLKRGKSPQEFGAKRGSQWPHLSVRRFVLYDVFLHELGHLQVVNERTRSHRRTFAGETKAHEFADYWRRRLWSRPFDHPDAVHNRPSEMELGQIGIVPRES
jgi:hypothetical protein